MSLIGSGNTSWKLSHRLDSLNFHLWITLKKEWLSFDPYHFQGAATTCYVALHPQVKGVSGEYFVDSNKAKPSSLAKDSEFAKKLWDFSLGMVAP